MVESAGHDQCFLIGGEGGCRVSQLFVELPQGIKGCHQSEGVIGLAFNQNQLLVEIANIVPSL